MAENYKTTHMSNKVTVLQPLDIHEEVIDLYYNNGFNGTKAVLSLKPELTYHTAGVLWQQIKNNKRNAAYIDNKRARLKAQADIQNENVVRELVNWMFADATDYIGLSVEEIKALPPDVRRCIGHIKVKTKTYFDPVIKGNVTEQYVEVKTQDKGKASESIAKYLGLYNEDNKQKGHNVNVLQILQDTNEDALNGLLTAMESGKPKP